MRTVRPWTIAIMLGVITIVWGAGGAVAADSGAYFVHTTTAGNTNLNSTTIESLLTNDKPDAIVHVTSRPDVGGGGDTNDNVVGVWYDDGSGNWKIFNQDVLASMPTNTQFSVWIPPADTSTFVHMATAGNTSGHVTSMDNPLTNGQPNAVLRVTQNYNPGGGAGIYNDHVIGVYYNIGTSKWTVFNQDFLAMPAGASFNVTVLPDAPTVFVHTGAGGANTEVDHPLTNDKSNAIMHVTQNWNPPGSSGVYNDHVVGVFYGLSRWWIFNQDLLDMLPDASFNVSVPPTESALFVHSADAGNSLGNHTWLDNPLTNGSPNAILFVTQIWNPGGGVGVYNDHHIGVWYDNSESMWSVFNQDQLDMPEGASFNVLVPAVDASLFVHTAFVPIGNYTVIDNPLLNNDPDAIVHATQNWNPGENGEVYNDHAIGVFYTGSSKWAVFNQDGVNMPMGASFNLWIPPADGSTFVHTATAANIFNNETWIGDPASNNEPDAILQVTQNFNPGGGAGVYNDHAIGVFHRPNSHTWVIFNEDGTDMTEGASFNVTVVIPPLFVDGFESGDTTAWSSTVP